MRSELRPVDLLGLGPRWPAISGCLWFRHRDEHCEAQAEDERFRVAVHVGEGEKGTEHHVGEAASGDARMQTEAAREMREEEDCWQDAGGHEEETETCGATLRGRTARPRLVHARRTYSSAYSVRTRHGCGKVHFSTQAEADRPWAETERLLQREHDDEGVHAQRPTVSIGMQLCDACSGGRLHAY